MSKPPPDPTKARILVVDDHPIVRQGLAQVIALQPDLRLCCEAGDFDEALVRMEQCRHDLAIVDVSLPDISGLTLVSALKECYPELPILVMSFHEENPYAGQSLQLGASGYINKHQAPANIVLAIRTLLQGGIYLGDALRGHSSQHLPSLPANLHDVTAMLTEREREILRLIGLGQETRQIAGTLNRSIKTIEAHRVNIKDKLGLKTGAELARFAVLWLENR